MTASLLNDLESTQMQKQLSAAPTDDEQIRRRIRAGRVIAGVTVEELAAMLGPGLQAGTLGKIERGERGIRAMELREIALALDLPNAFFSMDFHDAAKMLGLVAGGPR